MTMICLTFVLSVFLSVAAPVLTGWASGYLDVRSMYDVQISSQYNDVYREEDLGSELFRKSLRGGDGFSGGTRDQSRFRSHFFSCFIFPAEMIFTIAANTIFPLRRFR